jgi:hypothetical protein
MVPWDMVGYVTYAKEFGWTPQQVDQLTIQQDEWLIPVAHAIDAQRAYDQRKAAESAERAAKAKRSKGFS